ncbi:MAG: hypothetical protein QM652_05165 [Legionella sp.]|uniref:hypothetical protein n=1 Tax=Legionella sp. TaxID=459 RepID=UPI0039E6409F
MWEVIKYNKARQLIESRFKGIPHPHSTLIKSLLSLADPFTGIAKDISYIDLAKILTVKKAPGRKDSGTPTKQTIRNYIKSIEHECGDHFKVISEGQSLQFLFPDLPKIFNKICENREVNTELNLSETIVHNEKNTLLDKKDDIEVNTPTHTVKNNNYINNKQTNNKQVKVPISDNFYPDAETISIAEAKGYLHATNPAEIQAFIQHNKINNTQWADFNPIFLRWLARKSEYEAKHLRNKKNFLRNNYDECRANTLHTQSSAISKLCAHYGITSPLSWSSSIEEELPTHFAEKTHFLAMDEVIHDVR